MEALNRLYAAALRGAVEGWGPEDPVGYDPQTRAEGDAWVAEHPWAAPLGAFNRQIGYPAMAAADAALRLPQAGVGALAATAGQAADEVGLGPGSRLERDLLGMAHTAGMQVAGGGAEGLRMGLPPALQAAGERATQGRFVRGADGSRDLGHVRPAVAAASEGKFPAAPVRMQRGLPGPEGYGARHISPDKHERARALGFGDGLDLIKDTAKRHDMVVEQANGRLMLVARDGANRYVIVDHRPMEQTGVQGAINRVLGRQPFYGVTTGYPDRLGVSDNQTDLARILRKKGAKKLWEGE